MAVVRPGRWLYLHVPKTGGKWVKHALRSNFPDAGLLRQTTHGNSWARFGHPDLEDVAEHSPIFRFAFVRNPVDFWRSFWRYRMRTKWQPKHEIDQHCMDNDFHAFVAKVLENLPGYASTMFERFVGPADAPIEFIGRQENLVADLCLALELAGEDALRLSLDIPRVNAGADATAGVAFTPRERAALADAERAGLERYGYSE